MGNQLHPVRDQFDKDAHRVYIPITSKAWSSSEEAALFAQLRRAKPYGVFLCAERCLGNEAALTNEIAVLRDNFARLRALDIKVGIWACPTIGYGDKTPQDNEAVYDWAHLKSVWNGKELRGACYPTDEPMSRYENCDLGPNPSLYGRGSFLMMSQRFLCDQSVPLAYRLSDGACAAFGESAKTLPEEACRCGVITDAIGARHLMARGIDVGAVSCELAPRPVFEHFIDEDDDRPVGAVGTFYRFALKPQASVKSRFVVGSRGFGSSQAGTDAYPACYIYENAKRQRFMVYTFDLADFVEDSIWATGVSKSYYRQRQMQSGIAELQGFPLPAVCPGQPFLHLICGEKDGALSVGLWNFGRDPVWEPEIILGRRYGSIESFGSPGRLEGNRVRLDEPLQPYSFRFFRVRP